MIGLELIPIFTSYKYHYQPYKGSGLAYRVMRRRYRAQTSTIVGSLIKFYLSKVLTYITSNPNDRRKVLTTALEAAESEEAKAEAKKELAEFEVSGA